MSEPLATRLRRLRGRIRQVLAVSGVSWVVAVLFGAVLVVGLVDWAVHLDDAGVRFVLLLAILGTAGWVAWRHLVAPLLKPFSDVELALRIERRFPGLRDSLTSTVEFLAAGTDPRVGSPELQRHVISGTLRDIERVDVGDILETRSVRRVAIAAIAVCLVVAVIAGFRQAEAATALNRLLFPFSAPAWPKKTELAFFTPEFQPLPRSLRLARGETLEVFIENVRGELPADLAMEYRFGEGEQVRERVRQTTRRDGAGRSRQVGVATFVVEKGPVRFRAVGGDDDEMPWHVLSVVPPPVVERLQVTLTPPAYLGGEPQPLPEGVGHVQALVGTEVEFEAVASKPLARARLRVKSDPPQSLAIAEGGQGLRAAFTLREPGVYSWWLELRDREGFENPEAPRYEIRAIADQVPQISIEEPATSMLVTPEAEIEIVLAAKDDLGLRDIRLQYRIDAAQPGTYVALPLAAPAARPQNLTVEYTWPLAELQLQPGESVVFHAEATDYFDLFEFGPEHVGKSISRTLTVVTPQDKQAELATRHGSLLEELDEILRTQQQAERQTGEVEDQWQIVGRLRPEDVDLLKRIELDQRQITSRLHNPVDGVEVRTDQLRRELQANRIDDAEMNRRLEQIAEELSLLREDHLPLIEHELTQARKAAQEHAPRSEVGEGDPQKQDPPRRDPPADAADPAQALARARDGQQAVIESLSETLRHLAQWRNRLDLSSEVRELISGQERLNREAAEVARQTIGKGNPRQNASDLSAQEKADLKRLADRQRSQASLLGRFRRKLDELSGKLLDVNPEMAGSLEDIRDELRSRATESRMLDTARQLEENQVGEAGAAQEQILEELRGIEDILQNRGAPDTETLVKRMREAEAELETLRQRQDELLRKAEQAAESPDTPERELELQQLRQEQQQLRRDMEGMARRLRRMQAHRASDSARRAASRMRQAEEQLGDPDGADEAAALQQEALDDLEQAQRELAERRRQAEERLAREMLERIADQLRSMIPRQQNVIDETTRLDGLVSGQHGRLNREQRRTLLGIAAAQRDLQADTDRLAETIKAAEVFELALRGAARLMHRSAERLDAGRFDEATIALQTAARQRFVDLMQALEEDRDDGGDRQQAGTPEGGQRSGGPQTDGIPHLAQLKMLKTLQEDLLRRTAELDELRAGAGTGRLPAELHEELNQLAEEQGRLGDLARNLTRQFVEAFTTEDPERE